jgi:hypothetical protein
MLKEVCAQCLQKHIDPVSGKETIIFSCFNQDQRWTASFSRTRGASASEHRQEKLSNMWLDHLLHVRPLPHI